MVGEDLQLIWLFKSSQLRLYYRNFQFFFFFFQIGVLGKKWLPRIKSLFFFPLF